MKKFKVLFILTILLFISLSYATTDKKNVSKNKKEYKVTFIELGSKNCIPCKMMKKVMDEVDKEYGDQVEIIFHDVWTKEGKPYAEKYGIRAIPTQIFLDKNGKEYARHEGFFPKEDLVEVLKKGGVEKIELKNDTNTKGNK